MMLVLCMLFWLCLSDQYNLFSWWLHKRSEGSVELIRLRQLCTASNSSSWLCKLLIFVFCWRSLSKDLLSCVRTFPSSWKFASISLSLMCLINPEDFTAMSFDTVQYLRFFLRLVFIHILYPVCFFDYFKCFQYVFCKFFHRKFGITFESRHGTKLKSLLTENHFQGIIIDVKAV